MFTKIPIDHSTNNIVERLKVALIKLLFDNLIYVGHPQNTNFDYLPFDGDERFITIQWIYRINGDILEIFNNGSIVDVYINRI